MIKLGFVGRPLDLTIEKVQEESASVAQNIPVKEVVTHAPQEAQFGQSQKSELAMFGTLQQFSIGAQLERNRPFGASLINGNSPAMQELLEKLENLEGEQKAVASQMRQIEEEFATLDPNDQARAIELQGQYYVLGTRRDELIIEIKMVRMEIQETERKEAKNQS